MNTTRKPEIGDVVSVTSTISDAVYTGKVEELLSVQFTYIDMDGNTRYAFYGDEWRVLGVGNE